VPKCIHLARVDAARGFAKNNADSHKTKLTTSPVLGVILGVIAESRVAEAIVEKTKQPKRRRWAKQHAIHGIAWMWQVPAPSP
jgi:hypothetical protein